MKLRFIFLAILAGILMVVALPLGIVFFIIMAYFYVKSTMKEEAPKEVIIKEPKMEYPDIKKELNKNQYKKIQEKLR